MRARNGALLLAAASLCLAAPQLLSAEQTTTQSQEQVYGSQLMTKKELREHRMKMRAAKTAEERAQIRREHHEKMKARAKERGFTLPEEPPAMGMGKGLGPGGGGMGPRGGQGR